MSARRRHAEAKKWRHAMNDLRAVAVQVRPVNREAAGSLLRTIDKYVAIRRYDDALALAAVLVAMSWRDLAVQRTRVRRGLLMLRLVAWLALVVVLASGVLLASR